MNKMTVCYIVWRHVNNNAIADMKEVVGVVVDRLEAEQIVKELNKEEPKTYWKEEFPVLTLETL